MAFEDDGDVLEHLSDTEEMEDDNLNYDSDSTNMSVSVISETEDNIATDDSSHSGDRQLDDEMEPGSPVIGERRLQDGIVLSQRLGERVRTPPILEVVIESDEEEEDQDGPTSRAVPHGIPYTLPPESMGGPSMDYTLQVPNPSTSQNRRSPLREESESNIRHLIVAEQSSSDDRQSPLPEQSTSVARHSPIPEQSTSVTRHSPIPEQSTSVTRHSPIPEQSTSDTRVLADLGSDETRTTTESHPLLCEVIPTKNQIAADEEPASPKSDDEGQICSICFEEWANSGAHRLASLKCGHIFGHSCIERWLKGQGGKCPQCNAKATKKDIRVLYAKSLKVLDTSERDRVVRELEKEKEARRKLELEHAQTKLQFELKSQMVLKLQGELKMLRNATLHKSINSSQGINMSQGTSLGSKNKLIIHSSLDIVKDGGCRVMAYNEWLNMIVLSMPSQVSMFPGSGVKKINMLDIKAERFIPIHQKQIRDLAFNPSKNDLLLSVGMDKLVKLTNICNNAPVGSFTAEAPLWSCCWNADQANQFFVGTATGAVIMYDTRNTTGPVQTFKVAGTGPVVSMCYVPYNASANFSSGGLLVARLQSCSFVVVKEDGIQDHALLLEGPFTSVSFERSTRHILVSCRPSQKHPHARHLVCELQTVDISASASVLNQVITANVIQTFRGGTTQKVLSRSSIIAHPLQTGTILACASDESTQSTCVWDVSSGSCLQQLKCNETVIDILQVKSNQNAYLALLTDKSVKFYKWVDVL